ncbi:MULTISPECIES: SMU1112c/YaeR family gloxylase I-like metalloprotein [Sphingobacterium]|jgi:glyoxylase I family protein|uniref:SMU1112c/YaeR family gloxylase I-like metalloprotein n=1 Tax=Sphingobacterium TaxID=28453 RepID=UPI0004E5FAF2|nr:MULTISPECIES: VOC family protein [Sphingobacterium]UXD70562.1 VOC family protein [Sphingobacterium faecium]WGQ14134.1 VOC family protein [Sphingobacterium faecium]CDS91828.1 putative S-C lyase [Sphingobacterium sp. PM2-P1-29]HCU45238.1 VOC family protein [Sphingobacterium sp.]
MPLNLQQVHHIAIICSDYERSKKFYTDILGLTIIQEVYRESRNSYKLDLALNDSYIIELFSFTHPPQRISKPEAVGLRHLAFAVSDIEKEVQFLKKLQIAVEPIRIDEWTHKKFTFFEDPDGLPLELYEI